VRHEGVAEVAKVVPGGFCGDETASEDEARSVINGEQEDLLLLLWPPRVDGAVVLPEFARVGAAETAAGTGLGFWARDEVAEVFFDIGFHRGARAHEAAEAREFVGNELEVGGRLQGQKLFEKGERFGRLSPQVVASACTRLVTGFVWGCPKPC